jgi:hypothetical protein
LNPNTSSISQSANYWRIAEEEETIEPSSSIANRTKLPELITIALEGG